MLQETEMREFFDRIIGDFTGLNEAARKVDALTERVDALTTRVGELEQENASLKGEVKEAWEYARQVEDKANGLQTSLADSQAQTVVLKETIVMADSRVTELTRQNSGAMVVLEQAQTERDEARNQVKDYEIYNADLKQQLEEMTKDKNQWQDTAYKYESTIKSLTETVSRVQSILNPQPTVQENVEFFPQSNVG